MPFWLLVLVLVALVALCWSGGYGVYRGVPDGRGLLPGGLLGLLGLIFVVVLIIMFVVGIPGATPSR